MGHFEIIQTNDNVWLHGDKMQDMKLSFCEGRCAANSKNPNQPRRNDWYLENVLNPMIHKMEISDGSCGRFDDRKFRLDMLTVYGKTLRIALGITHYKAFKEPFYRTDRENKLLQDRGIEDHNDRWAYFPRCPGIAGLVVSSEGSAFLGERTNELEKKKLNSAAGHVKYHLNPEEVNLVKDLERELGELGVLSDHIVHHRFVGAYSHSIRGDFDFTYIVKTNRDDEYFKSGKWKEFATEHEHDNLIQIVTYADVQRLLDEGVIGDKKYELMYSTRGALMSLTEGDMKLLKN